MANLLPNTSTSKEAECVFLIDNPHRLRSVKMKIDEDVGFFFLPDRATTLVNANSFLKKVQLLVLVLPVAASFKNFSNVRFIEGFYFIQSVEKGRY